MSRKYFNFFQSKSFILSNTWIDSWLYGRQYRIMEKANQPLVVVKPLNHHSPWANYLILCLHFFTYKSDKIINLNQMLLWRLNRLIFINHLEQLLVQSNHYINISFIMSDNHTHYVTYPEMIFLRNSKRRVYSWKGLLFHSLSENRGVLKHLRVCLYEFLKLYFLVWDKLTHKVDKWLKKIWQRIKGNTQPANRKELTMLTVLLFLVKSSCQSLWRKNKTI